MKASLAALALTLAVAPVLGWRAFGADAFADPLELGQHLDVKGGR